MGVYCVLTQIPHHSARVGEILEVLWSDYYGAVLFGDGQEVACIPHAGCRLEIVATAPTPHPAVNLLLPGNVVGYRRSLFLPDRLVLSSGTKAWLCYFVGFKLQLIPNDVSLPPREEDIIDRLRRTSLRRRQRLVAARGPCGAR